MKVKQIKKQTTSRHEYNMAHLFGLDFWSQKEMKYSRHKFYGGYSDNLRRPNWKFQKVKKQWMVKPFKVKTWKGPSNKLYNSIEV